MRFTSVSILALASASIGPAFVAAKQQIKGGRSSRHHRDLKVNETNLTTGRALKAKKEAGGGECLPDYSEPTKKTKATGGCEVGCDSSCLENLNADITSEFADSRQACVNSEDESLQVGIASCIGGEACANALKDITVGDRSCIGGKTCLDLEEDVQIGNDACIGNNECKELVGGSVIGDGSCVGKCDNNVANSLLIGVLSCMGYEVCTIGSENGGDIEIGDHTCHGGFGCTGLGLDGFTTKLGNKSCIGYDACREFGYYGGGILGDRSCLGDSACGFIEAKPVTMGNLSCHGYGACFKVGVYGQSDPVTIENNACHGYGACEKLSFADVGDNSCIGRYTCYKFNYEEGGAIASKVIGTNSCIGDDACKEVVADIGCGSCHGDHACSVVTKVGDSACIGNNACLNPALPGERPGEVPDNMCNRPAGTWVTECNTPPPISADV